MSVALPTLSALRGAAPKDVNRLATVFHALSDVTRIRIVEMLLTGEQCVCDLTETLDAAQSRLSFHMKVLKEAGLITDRREGRWVFYMLNAQLLTELESFFAVVRARAAEVTSCCKP